MSFRSIRLVDVLEAAYGELESATSTWLEGVLAAVRPGFDQGLGVQGYLVDASDPERFETSDWTQLGLADATLGRAAFEAWERAVPTAFKRRVHTYAPFGTGSTLPRDVGTDPLEASNEAHGYVEMIGLNGLDPTHRGVAIAAAATHPIAMPARPLTRLWEQVAAHLATAARLRRSLAGARPDTTGEAVMAPDGKLVDARGEARAPDARQALRQAARAIDRARSGKARDDSAATLELWRALVLGRWSLVDSFETDGRRYLLAVPNAPGLEASEQLSERERVVLGGLMLGHGNKLIAYELGVSVSTVATHLARAAKKLGARDRVELVRLLGDHPELAAPRRPR